MGQADLTFRQAALTLGSDGVGQPSDVDALRAALRPETRLVLAEAPTNPYQTIPDIEQVVEICREKKVKTLVDSIQDRRDNSTRFLVVGRKLLSASGADKTTLLVSTSDTAGGAGVLHSLLKPLADHKVNMTFIESRPSQRQNWDYVFFIDVEGHASESPLSDALEVLEKESSLYRVLGAYPKAVS